MMGQTCPEDAHCHLILVGAEGCFIVQSWALDDHLGCGKNTADAELFGCSQLNGSLPAQAIAVGQDWRM